MGKTGRMELLRFHSSTTKVLNLWESHGPLRDFGESKRLSPKRKGKDSQNFAINFIVHKPPKIYLETLSP